MTKEERINYIVKQVPSKFRTMGGGKTDTDNPIVKAMEDLPLMFSTGIGVKEVVKFIVEQVEHTYSFAVH